MKQSKKGRKPIKDKKEPVTVFLQGSAIRKHGGKEKVKEKIRDYIVITALILICLFAENFMP